MTPRRDDDRRLAPRWALPKPAPATFGGFTASIVEVSLIGCQIEHTDRIAPKTRLSLRFSWRGSRTSLDATVMRSEMRSLAGRAGYMSGLSFCESPAESPLVIREIVGWLADAAKRSFQPEEAPPVDLVEEEADVVSAPYLQCRLSAGAWDRLYVSEPVQPPDGFTILAPPSDAEVDILCRAYQSASAQKRQQMRASFEAAITREPKH